MSLFRNHAVLTSEGLAHLRSVALDIAIAGLDALDPAPAVDRHVSLDGQGLLVGGNRYEPPGRVIVLGAGKASYRIARRIEEVLGDRVAGGLVVVRRGEGGPLSRIEIMEADHPVPSEASVAASNAMLEFADRLGPDDLALCCVTGGSSALLSCPPGRVSLEDKQELHRLMLSSGAAINEMNAVRKHVSDVKGGRLAARIAPAPIVNLTVSDVVGDVIDLITGPTVQDTTTPVDAVSVLRRRGLWDRVARPIRDHLASPEAESPDLRGMVVDSFLILAGSDGCEAMRRTAATLGYRSHVLSSTTDAEAVETGRRVAMAALGCATSHFPVRPPCVLIGCGGESTVTLDSRSDVLGSSGPNQEVALAAAMALDGSDRVALLAMDTDGSDGGSMFAGGIADGDTMRRAREAGIDPAAHLRDHTAGEALGRLGDLLDTGPTGTNANDLVVAVVGES